MSQRPPQAGLRHIALFVEAFEATADFYMRVMGMAEEWRPDPDNLYLCSGNDNLALHRWQGDERASAQRLDHIGFIVDRAEHVDAWHEWLLANEVSIVAPPKTHRDGARSLYCRDPDGTVVQIIHHPPISAG